MNEFKDDTFLSRWINGELSEEELAEFKKSEDYALYAKIISGAELINSAAFDSNAILAKIKRDQALVVGTQNQSKWMYYAAASIMLLIGLVAYLFISTNDLASFQTMTGQKMKVDLPDGSVVVLNANSKITYSEKNWNDNREISLEGEGYFKVKKGSQFVVQTSIGQVTVLGTEFTVKELKDFYEVMCFEGSVRVQTAEGQEVLKPKTSVRRTRNRLALRNILIDKPSWIANKSTFTSVPISYVLEELKNQYGIRFEGQDILDDVSFNGTFPHDNINLALKIVLDPINITYEKKGNVVVLSKD